jgi:voltage-gated sodium channel
MLTRYLLDERKILWPILLNAAVLFALGFSQLPASATAVLNLADDAITTIFVLELVLKVRALGVRGYFKSNWNRLDFVLVVLSLPSLVSHAVEIGRLDLSYLLVLRVCRVFKFFRFLRFVPGIEQMLLGVQRALRASIMLIFAFFIALFVVSLLSTKLFGTVDPEHYGDPIRAIYSTFKIFTVEGWFEIPDAMADKLDGPMAGLIRLFFSLLLLAGGIVGLSLVNSVFVDAMVADNNADLERKVDALRDEIAALRRDLRGEAPREESSDAH